MMLKMIIGGQRKAGQGISISGKDDGSNFVIA